MSEALILKDPNSVRRFIRFEKFAALASKKSSGLLFYFEEDFDKFDIVDEFLSAAVQTLFTRDLRRKSGGQPFYRKIGESRTIMVQASKAPTNKVNWWPLPHTHPHTSEYFACSTHLDLARKSAV
ncbi:hypothetical protein J6590_060719 [Homalodisca vitripennis]|nr:hypothetical protein J6590_060719 [Homalodisca vitripennis]